MPTGDLDIPHFIEQYIGGLQVIVNDRQPPPVIVTQQGVVDVAVVVVFNYMDISTGSSTSNAATSATATATAIAISEGLVQVPQAAHYLHEYSARILFRKNLLPLQSDDGHGNVDT